MRLRFVLVGLFFALTTVGVCANSYLELTSRMFVNTADYGRRRQHSITRISSLFEQGDPQSKDLSPYSHSTGIGDLPMSLDLDRTRTDGQIIRQSEDHLNKIGVSHGSHAFCQHVVSFVVCVA
jgi:hypothetical protein